MQFFKSFFQHTTGYLLLSDSWYNLLELAYLESMALCQKLLYQNLTPSSGAYLVEEHSANFILIRFEAMEL